jgi:hypothetical protein
MFNKKVLVDALKKLGSAKAPTVKKDNEYFPYQGESYFSMAKGGEAPYKKVSVQKSNVQGKGLFADESIGAGEVIGLSHTKFMFKKNGEDYIKSQETPIIGKYYNHSDDAFNVESIVNGDKRYLRALRDINPGEEILGNYYEDDDPTLESPDDFKKGGSAPKLPKKKNSKGYSRSLEATNRLFAEHPLFAKPRSRKNKIYDPKSKYYRDGGDIPYNNLPGPYQEALQNFVYPNVVADPRRTGHNALTNTISYDPESPIENVNNDWWMEHELFHELQNQGGGLSTSGVMGQRPNEYVASDQAIQSYYDRRDADVNRVVDQMIAENPELQFIPREQLIKGGPGFVGAESLQYSDPSTLEGEARQYEQYIEAGNPSIFPKKRNGGETPEDYQEFLDYSATAPENRRPGPDYFYGNPDDYDHYGMWDALGKPKNFEEALQMNPDWTPDEYDGMYHGFSVNPNTGVFLKAGKPGGMKEGDTTWMEIAGHYLSPRANESTPVFDIDLQRFKYIPNEEYIETELSPEEIQEYAKGGYIIEDISIPSLTKAKKGGLVKAWKGLSVRANTVSNATRGIPGETTAAANAARTLQNVQSQSTRYQDALRNINQNILSSILPSSKILNTSQKKINKINLAEFPSILESIDQNNLLDYIDYTPLTISAPSGNLKLYPNNRDITDNEWHFTAFMNNQLEAGKAFLAMNKLFPLEKPTLLEPTSLSLDSHNLLTNFGLKNKDWDMDFDGHILLNSMAKHNNLFEGLPRYSSLSLNTFTQSELDQFRERLNNYLKNKGLKEEAIIDTIPSFSSGPDYSRILVPNYRLTRKYNKGGISKYNLGGLIRATEPLLPAAESTSGLITALPNNLIRKKGTLLDLSKYQRGMPLDQLKSSIEYPLILKGKSGHLELKPNFKDINKNVWHFYADMTSPPEAGRAFLVANELFPLVNPTIHEPNSLSLDSFNTMLNMGQKRGGDWEIQYEDDVPLNFMHQHSTLFNQFGVTPNNRAQLEREGLSKFKAESMVNKLNKTLKERGIKEGAYIVPGFGIYDNAYDIYLPNYKLTRKYDEGGDIDQDCPEGYEFNGTDCVPIQQAADINTKILTIGDSVAGGGYNKKFAGSGVPKALMVNDYELLPAATEGTYCSGFTCWAATEAMKEQGLLDEMTPEQLKKFQQTWYGAEGFEKGKSETLSTKALEDFGLGKGISREEALPGDIAQIWRNDGSGHSVIFKDWVKDDQGNITGIKYRSSQGSTDGIGDRTEIFKERGINPDKIYLGRIGKFQQGGETDYELGDEVDEATMQELQRLGYTFEKI